MIAYIGLVYREQYKRRCRSMSWNVPLRALQAVAISLGGIKLGNLCRMYCVAYRQFQSGAPDLLCIRGYRYKEDDVQFVNWNEMIGCCWKSSFENANILSDKDENYLVHSPTIQSNTQSTKDKITIPVVDSTSIALPDEVTAVDVKDNEIHADNINTEQMDGDTNEINIDDWNAEIDYDVMFQHNFDYNEPDILPPKNDDVSEWDTWTFECMLVEVKGPTDKLADKQLKWLQALTHFDIPAVVCRVREGFKGDSAEKRGNHRSAQKELQVVDR